MTGKMQPLWNLYPGGRDALAKTAGTAPTVLSALNTGSRGLGDDLWPRLRTALEAEGIDPSPLQPPARLALPTFPIWEKFLPLALAAEMTPELRLILEAAVDELEASAAASRQLAAVVRERLVQESPE